MRRRGHRRVPPSLPPSERPTPRGPRPDGPGAVQVKETWVLEFKTESEPEGRWTGYGSAGTRRLARKALGAARATANEADGERVVWRAVRTVITTEQTPEPW